MVGKPEAEGVAQQDGQVSAIVATGDGLGFGAEETPPLLVGGRLGGRSPSFLEAVLGKAGVDLSDLQRHKTLVVELAAGTWCGEGEGAAEGAAEGMGELTLGGEVLGVGGADGDFCFRSRCQRSRWCLSSLSREEGRGSGGRGEIGHGNEDGGNEDVGLDLILLSRQLRKVQDDFGRNLW